MSERHIGRTKAKRVGSEAQGTRRAFLKRAVAAAGATAAVAMPQVARAQETVTLKFQSTWPQKDIFHEYAQDYVNRVNEMSGGRLKLDLLAAGAVAKAFEMQDAVISGTLDGGHGVCAYWYGKNKAYSLFGTPPAWGWRANNRPHRARFRDRSRLHLAYGWTKIVVEAEEHARWQVLAESQRLMSGALSNVTTFHSGNLACSSGTMAFADQVRRPRWQWSGSPGRSRF